jgi:hypothetical protein
MTKQSRRKFSAEFKAKVTKLHILTQFLGDNYELSNNPVTRLIIDPVILHVSLVN